MNIQEVKMKYKEGKTPYKKIKTLIQKVKNTVEVFKNTKHLTFAFQEVFLVKDYLFTFLKGFTSRIPKVVYITIRFVECHNNH